MNRISKIMGGAAAVLASASMAAPAQAQYGGYYHRDRDRGIDAGDIITGVAILGGIAAIASALDRDGSRYGYGNRYRYRNDYRNAVNSCGYQAERYARGARVRITDVDRRGRRSYRVRGVIENGYSGYDRYDRYDRYDPYGRSGGYYGNSRYGGQLVFSCTARDNGRILDFDVNRYGGRYGY